ncbi:hypothetical protein [Bacillus sp. UMB0893]|uniref:hypothetical protein n=1 Tax=Bacillus sp. UMB0893 TaxID=2066053 RepID=UPI001C60AEC3|nr:hypothetical protein [Bacillus sp. UMB0893]
MESEGMHLKDKLERKSEIVDIKQRILSITCRLANDNNYKKDDAIKGLVEVISMLDGMEPKV